MILWLPQAENCVKKQQPWGSHIWECNANGKSLIYIFPPLPCTLTALFAQNSAFLVAELMEYVDLGKEGIEDIYELHLETFAFNQL